MIKTIKNLLKLIILKRRYPGSRVSFLSDISLDTVLNRGVNILSGSKIGRCNVSAFTYIGRNCNVERTNIGPFTSIGPEVICGSGSHPTNFISTYPGFYTNHSSGSTWFGEIHTYLDKKDVNIGADVWIGTRSIILGGVSIGHGAVVGAGAVVTKNVPAFAIVAGVPAKIIRYRFEPKIILEILESKWWEASENSLRKVAKYANNPIEFIDKLQTVKDEF